MVKNRETILIVDDEPSVVKYVIANLRAEGYKPLAAANGIEALEVIEKEAPDLVILDILMPKLDGFEVCRRLRRWSSIPVIMLSAKDAVSDKVKCLESGADDYLSKPFSAKELIARIKAVLRRTGETNVVKPPTLFSSGNLRIDFGSRQILVSGVDVRLTPTEFNTLRELVLNADKVLTHTQLLQKIWGPEYGSEKEYLRVFIGRLRDKLESDPSKPSQIVTVPGVGYQFKTYPEE